jgi:hypothetical protein
VDFKTHGWKKASDFFRVRDEAIAQLQLYAIAVREALHMDAHSAYVHFLAPKAPPDDLRKEGVSDEVRVDVSPKKIGEMKSRIQRTVGEIKQSIEKKRFALAGSETGHCERCDFRMFCPGYKKWDTSDKVTPRPPDPEVARELEMQLVEEELNARQEPKQ